MSSEKKVLLLCHYYPGIAGTIKDHILSFTQHSVHEYFIFSNLGDLPEWLDLLRFDCLIIHYSLIVANDYYVSPATRLKIREFQGFKAVFIQDDYRWINKTVDSLSYMRINALFPLTSQDIMDVVYSPERLPNVRKEVIYAGYVPQHLISLKVKKFSDRKIDVGYRARKAPAWLGSHTLQKWQIADRFLKDGALYELFMDISYREEDRIYGKSWINFVTNCKAMLGTESGASVCDFTGDIQQNTEKHLEVYPDADFEELCNLFFKNEDCKYLMNVISPRCFEAAALRTLMVLYEGKYSGVLVPWRHYVPLKKDHSNMSEVIDVVRSEKKAQKIIDFAYKEIALNESYSYSAMVKLVDRVIDEQWQPSMTRPRSGFSQIYFYLRKKNLKKIIGNFLLFILKILPVRKNHLIFLKSRLKRFKLFF